MAKAKIRHTGTKVDVTLTLREAAAVFAILTNINPDTDKSGDGVDLNAATFAIWTSLDEVRTELGRYWHPEFEELAESSRGLTFGKTGFED